MKQAKRTALAAIPNVTRNTGKAAIWMICYVAVLRCYVECYVDCYVAMVTVTYPQGLLCWYIDCYVATGIVTLLWKLLRTSGNM